MSIDQRGFKEFIQAEAAEFLQPSQVRYNSTVTNIMYSESGVSVTLADGETLEADYALCTFSLGVLQHDDVAFEPPLPSWKQEAIQSMDMVSDAISDDAILSAKSYLRWYRQRIPRSLCSSRRSSGSILR